jgi:hypothetical protein
MMMRAEAEGSLHNCPSVLVYAFGNVRPLGYHMLHATVTSHRLSTAGKL